MKAPNHEIAEELVRIAGSCEEIDDAKVLIAASVALDLAVRDANRLDTLEKWARKNSHRDDAVVLSVTWNPNGSIRSTADALEVSMGMTESN